ncbi:MAG: RNA polymerase sigma-70 factor (ECF subfamily) [Kiritimatiellia bacterium]|jgi:RNA polymerase sigma-70 factor (ECF subfamily)
MDEIQEWVKLSQAGDEAAFGKLVVSLHERLYAVLYRIVGNADDARELEQQTWIKVWNKLHTFKGESAFYTWVYRVATYTALDFLRKRKRRPEMELLEEMDLKARTVQELPPSARSRPDREMQRAELRQAFDHALAKLSDKHRTALVLREVDGLSYEEIADVMECRIGTVMSRIFNARKAMQEHLKDLSL